MNEEKQLFQLAKQLYQAALWEDYWDTDLLALKLPHRDEPAFVSIMGKGEETYGFLFYRDLEELSYYFEMVKQVQLNDFEEPLEYLLLQKGFSLNYEDRLDLPKEDYNRVKDSGVAFRGRKAWPIFRDYEPGFYPIDIDTEEIPFINELLEKFLQMGEDYRFQLDQYDAEENKNRLFLRSYQEDETYIDSWFTIPQSILEGVAEPEYPLEPVQVTEFELRRAETLKIGSSIWELELNYIPIPVETSKYNRPRFIVMLMVADAKSAQVLASEFVEFEDTEKIQRLFLQTLLMYNVKPPTVVVNVSRFARISSVLGAFLYELGIELNPIYKLPLISSIQKDMLPFLNREV